MKIDRLTPPAAALRELGQRLAHIRKQQGLTQEDLAARAGIGVATLRRIEDGKDSKLGSWLRVLVALGMEAAIEQLLPADFRSPLAEVKGERRRRARKAGAANAREDDDAGGNFVWGDERK